MFENEVNFEMDVNGHSFEVLQDGEFVTVFMDDEPVLDVEQVVFTEGESESTVVEEDQFFVVFFENETPVFDMPQEVFERVVEELN